MKILQTFLQVSQSHNGTSEKTLELLRAKEVPENFLFYTNLVENGVLT